MKVQELIQQASSILARIDSGKLDAEIILALVLGKDRAWLRAWPEAEVDEDHCNSFFRKIERRKQHEPVAYITGVREFWSRAFLVNESVLIPRPETELIPSLVLDKCGKEAASVLDLGTGSGCIAVTIALEKPDWKVTAVDVEEAALETAFTNAHRLGARNARFVAGSWFGPVKDEKFDVIVSNPPYIEPEDPHLQQGDVQFEPESALVSGVDGLEDIRKIISQAPAHLLDAGILMLEHGWDQAGRVRELMEQAGFVAVSSEKDLQGTERVSYGMWQGGD